MESQLDTRLRMDYLKVNWQFSHSKKRAAIIALIFVSALIWKNWSFVFIFVWHYFFPWESSASKRIAPPQIHTYTHTSVHTHTDTPMFALMHRQTSGPVGTHQSPSFSSPVTMSCVCHNSNSAPSRHGVAHGALVLSLEMYFIMWHYRQPLPVSWNWLTKWNMLIIPGLGWIPKSPLL